ncbi:hypothetical protein EYC84_000918 [Monilinia fructicola]|uniref:Uncharacterized protein n=1 Tax=Monilinia fructicola TaxID=38448 RepID=A0A5M9JIH0_MONFR|nr:hypothetical protein EYC84_000918 [Monilinia fructicola]
MHDMHLVLSHNYSNNPHHGDFSFPDVPLRTPPSQFSPSISYFRTKRHIHSYTIIISISISIFIFIPYPALKFIDFHQALTLFHSF